MMSGVRCTSGFRFSRFVSYTTTLTDSDHKIISYILRPTNGKLLILVYKNHNLLIQQIIVGKIFKKISNVCIFFRKNRFYLYQFIFVMVMWHTKLSSGISRLKWYCNTIWYHSWDTLIGSPWWWPQGSHQLESDVFMLKYKDSKYKINSSKTFLLILVIVVLMILFYIQVACCTSRMLYSQVEASVIPQDPGSQDAVDESCTVLDCGIVGIHWRRVMFSDEFIVTLFKCGSRTVVWGQMPLYAAGEQSEPFQNRFGGTLASANGVILWIHRAIWIYMHTSTSCGTNWCRQLWRCLVNPLHISSSSRTTNLPTQLVMQHWN